MKQYLAILQDILDNGYVKAQDRTGAGRKTIEGRMLRFDVSDGTVPLVTTRKLYPRSIIGELLWFIKGSNDVNELRELGVRFWDRWAVTEESINDFLEKFVEPSSPEEMKFFELQFKESYLDSIGPIYGPNWRNAPISGDYRFMPKRPLSDLPSDKLALYRAEYEEQNTIGAITDFKQEEYEEYCNQRYNETIDQLNEMVNGLKQLPYSSRHVVNAWIPEFIPLETLSPQMNVLLGNGALAPCHVMFQCFVRPPQIEGQRPRLSLMMTQRSADWPVGTPINIAQYSLLLHMLAHVCYYDPGEFIYSIGDVHIYGSNHEKLANIQLQREPLPLPGVWLNPNVRDLFAFTPDDIRIEGYQHHDILNYDVHV